MLTRKASHAGSWYSANPAKLTSEIDSWLANVPEEQKDRAGVKAVIGPHAGFAYSGETAAFAYAQVDPSPIKRIFVLGPSHRFYLPDCALTKCESYATPLGDVPIDVEVVNALRSTGLFRDLSLKQDEAEHCVELHLPFIRRRFAPDVRLVPVVVGSLSQDKEKEYGELLAPYFADPATFVAISTDFCHWGARFGYTYYAGPSGVPTALSSSRKRAGGGLEEGCEVWESIERLDREAMGILEKVGEAEGVEEVHELFEAYFDRTDNTICGRHSLGVLLGAMASLTAPRPPAAAGTKAAVGWVRYDQSERVVDPDDSSVSYAAGWASW